MGAGWVAARTRARAMLAGRVGADRARVVATHGTLADAVRALASSPYGRDLDPAAAPAEAQRAVSAAALWQLRVLAGWQPTDGLSALRLLAADFETANTAERLRSFDGARIPPPYRLGALSTAWPVLSAAASPAAIRAALAASAWGDPGADSPAAVVTGMQLSAADRTAARLPRVARWASGRAAVLVARESFVADRGLTEPSRRRAERLLGREAMAAGTFLGFRNRLPAAARWPLAGIDDPAELWRAEAHCQVRVEEEALALAHRPDLTAAPVLGVAAALLVDAWRVRAALLCAAHGGHFVEAYDALAV